MNLPTVISLTSAAIFSSVIVALVNWLCPTVIPFSFFQLWEIKGSLWEAVKFSWIPFAWGTGITAIFAFSTRNDWRENRDAEKYMLKGLVISSWAGFAEEICFRWLIFFAAIAAYTAINYVTFGYTRWMYLHIVGPVANWCTLGYMHNLLFNDLGWAVGAAMVSTNGKFRDGHAYQGLLGFVNSWFLGMFFFYLVFRFGLVAAILVHFLYDLFIFGVGYLDRVIERAMGRKSLPARW